MIDKEKFVGDIKKNLEIKSFSESGKYFSEITEESFGNLDEIYKAFEKDADKDVMNNPNNIYETLKISKNEAENGCEKIIKFVRKRCSEIKTREIKVKIPSNIKESQKIILLGEGNIDQNERKGNLIIYIKIR